MGTLDFRDLEGYLPDPKAVVRAFPAIKLPLAELETLLEPARTMPKTALSGMLSH